MSTQLIAEQDGKDFFDSVSNKHIASYDCVQNDCDLEGAQEARRLFLLNHPVYRMAEYNDDGDPV